MLVLQQINRSVRINRLILRGISTTKVRQDDDEKSLSDSQKNDIRQKLRAVKERLLKQEKKEDEETTPTASLRSKESASIKNEKTIKFSSDRKITEKQESVVKQTAEKLKDEKGEKQKGLLKNLSEAEVETEEESEKDKFSKKDFDMVEILKKQEVLTKQRQAVKKQKAKLKSLLEEPVEITQEPENEEISTKESDTHEKLEKQREIKKKTSLKKLLEDDVDEVEDPKPETDKKVEDEQARQLKGKMKLQQLIKQSENFSVEDKVEIPHPVKKIRPVEKAGKQAESNQHVKILKSIMEVADELGGDVDKTETELMNAVFKSTASEESERKRLQDPAKDRMSSVLGDLNVDLTKDQKVDPQIEIKRTLAMIKDLQRRSDLRPKESEAQDYPRKAFPLFDAKPLNVFDDDYLSNLKETPVSEFYDKIKQKELMKLVTHSPANIYEEMIKWTKEGKLWHFPIDNEWKWSWEENVDFSEHVLLEHHLEPWCPTGGPIRHFMELVCVGLTKNPYIAAEEKREHIYWFKDYFEEKRRLLEDVGAFRIDKKQIEQGEEIS